MFWEVLKTTVFASTLGITFRSATPLLFGSMGGCFNQTSGQNNIAYECVMLFGALLGFVGSYYGGSPWAGALLAMAGGVVISMVFGVFVIIFKSNPIFAGVALNSGAWAMTTLIMVTLFGTRGSIAGDSGMSFSYLHFKFLENSDYLNTVFNNRIILVYLAYVMIAVSYVIMFKTPFGLRIRGIGQNEAAAASVGVNPVKYRLLSLVLMGAFVGLGGCCLSIGGMSLFSESMTAGRGFLCVASMIIGGGNPIKIALVALLFSYSEAMSQILSMLGMNGLLVSTIPYIAVIIVLFISGVRAFKGAAELE